MDDENPYQAPLAEQPNHPLADDLKAFRRWCTMSLLSALIGAFGVAGVIFYVISIDHLIASARRGAALQVAIQPFLLGTVSVILGAVCIAVLRRMK